MSEEIVYDTDAPPIELRVLRDDETRGRPRDETSSPLPPASPADADHLEEHPIADAVLSGRGLE